MKRLLILIYSLLFFSLHAQEKVCGKILDLNKNPLFGATVYNLHSGKGVITNMDGNFEILMGTRDTIRISYVGMMDQFLTFTQFGSHQKKLILLAPKDNQLIGAQIQGNRSLSQEFSIRHLNKLDVYLEPNSSGDPLKALTFLASSTNTSEGANPEFRGSAPNLSQVFFNGVPLSRPVRNSNVNGLGSFSILNAELMDNMDVYASNPPIYYSNCIAGLVDIKSKTDLVKEQEIKLSLSLANIGFFVSKKVKPNMFIQVFSNKQFSGPYIGINKKSMANIQKFSSIDLGLNLHDKLSPHLQLNLFSYFINEKYNAFATQLNYTGINQSSQKRNFSVFNIRYINNYLIGSFNSNYDLSHRIFNFGNIKANQNELHVYNSLDFKLIPLEKFSCQFGLSQDFVSDFFNLERPFNPFEIAPEDSSYSEVKNIKNQNLNAYLYTKLKLNPVVLGLGFRKNIPMQGQKGVFSYNASVRYNLTIKQALIFSAGSYQAFMVPTAPISSFTQVSANQLACEYAYTRKNSKVSLAIFKNIENSPQYFEDLARTEFCQTQIYGIEFSAHEKIQNFTIYFANTYLNSKTKRADDPLLYNTSNKMNYFLKLGLRYEFPSLLTLALSFTSHPGLYYTPIIGSSLSASSQYDPVYGDYNSANLSSYSELNFSLEAPFSLRKTHSVFFLELKNVLNKSNASAPIYTQDYSQLIAFSLFQKFLIYFGVQITI